MQGFFPSHLMNPSHSTAGLVPKCGRCKLNVNGCLSPKMKYTGKGKKGILIIGEAPGEHEDEQNKQFVGDAGQLLRSHLSKLGIDMREDCWLDNALMCYPGSKIDKKKEDMHVMSCQPHLINNIRELKPRLIIPLGARACRGLMKDYLYEEKGAEWTMSRWAGMEIPCQKLNAWICPNYHPSYLRRENNSALNLLFSRSLRSAIKKTERPWKKVPDFLGSVEAILDTKASLEAIAYFRSKTFLTFDYETTTLKPENKEHARIICCSISDGKRTICYPWNEKTCAATKDILIDSRIKKAGSNIKFEHRWGNIVGGFKVRGWVWDSMNGMHIEDCRRGITSIKFQGFAYLGQPNWSTRIEPNMKSENNNSPNKLHLVPPIDLYTYCGLDSLVEYIRTVQQMEVAGFPVPEGAYMGWKKYFN